MKQRDVQFIQESMDSIKSGFDDVVHSGPIAHESVRGLKFILHHFVPHEDPAHRGLAQLMPATKIHVRLNAGCKFSFA